MKISGIKVVEEDLRNILNRLLDVSSSFFDVLDRFKVEHLSFESPNIAV
jgi:hypothetical protein